MPESLLPVAGALTSRLLTYGTLILAARFLPGDAFGAFALGLVVLNLGSAVVSGGGDMWLNRFTRQGLFAGGSPPLIWPLYLGIAVLLAALVATLSSSTVALLDPIPGHATTLLLAGLAATLMGLGEAVLAVLRSARRVKLFFVLRDLVAPIGIFAGMAALRPQTDSAAISVPFAVWGVILAFSTIWLVAIRGRSVGRWHWYARAIVLALRHTGALIYGNLGSRLASSLDVLMLSGSTSLARVGAYRVGAQLSIGFPVVQHFMFLGLPWQLKHLSRESGVESGLEMLVRRQRLLLVLGAGGLALLGVFAEWVMWLFGPDFVPFAEILRWLLVVRFADLLWGPQHEVLVSNGRAMKDAHANVAAIVVWIASFALLISNFDALHSAVAAMGLALAAAQMYRYRMLMRAGLPSVTGLAGGFLVPLGATLAVVVALLASL